MVAADNNGYVRQQQRHGWTATYSRGQRQMPRWMPSAYALRYPLPWLSSFCCKTSRAALCTVSFLLYGFQISRSHNGRHTMRFHFVHLCLFLPRFHLLPRCCCRSRRCAVLRHRRVFYAISAWFQFRALDLASATPFFMPLVSFAVLYFCLLLRYRLS